METNERPVFVTTIGNTTIKIRSALPFMSAAEQKQWFMENESSPQVQAMKRAWIQAIHEIEEQNLNKLHEHGA